MKFRLREVASVLGGSVEADELITGWSVDSRTVQPGDLFFALRGPNHDGNAYLDEAFRKGAAAAIANEKANRPESGPVVVVPDTLVALQAIASRARSEW